MKKALILDFGGVISRTLFETHAMSERALKLPIGSMTWQGPFDQVDPNVRLRKSCPGRFSNGGDKT